MSAKHAPEGRPEVVIKAGEELRAPRAAGIAGLLFSALFIFSLVAARPPASQAQSGEALATWYAGESQVMLAIVGLYTIPFAGIAFLWFIGVVRDRIGRREDRLFSTVFLGSGLLFVAMLFASAAGATRSGASARRHRSTASGSRGDPVLAGADQRLPVCVRGSGSGRLHDRDVVDRAANPDGSEMGGSRRVPHRSTIAAECPLLRGHHAAVPPLGDAAQRLHADDAAGGTASRHRRARRT